MKVDSIMAENPDKTIDQLYAERKINVDQKAQAEKKPALKAQLASLEDQLEHYKKFDEDVQKRIASDKEALEKALETSHGSALESAKEEAYARGKADGDDGMKEKLLLLSRFLRAAAARRQAEDGADESAAFEGALLLVYGGDYNAVTAMENLVNGSDDIVTTVEGTASGFSCTCNSFPSLSIPCLQISDKQIRDSAVDATPDPSTLTEATNADVITAQDAAQNGPSTETDPTVLHASLTEIDQGNVATVSSAITDIPDAPSASSISANAANAAAQQGDWHPATDLSASAASGPDGWVEVPRDPAETDTGLTATPAADSTTQSWAEDVPANTVAPAGVNDGFHEVHHHRGGRGRGGFRGDGERRGRGSFRGEGGHRGRGRGGGGFRGDSEGRGRGGRGRGGFRTDRGGDRGGERGGERGEGRGGHGRNERSAAPPPESKGEPKSER